jgi:hypothetical protein
MRMDTARLLHCTYNISLNAQTFQNVLVQFQEFDLENYFDFVDLISSGTNETYRFTGGVIPDPVVLPAGDFVFNFTADELNARAGFMARIDLIADSSVRLVANGVCDTTDCYCNPPYTDSSNCTAIPSPCPPCPLFAGSTLSWPACSCQGTGYGPTYESRKCRDSLSSAKLIAAASSPTPASYFSSTSNNLSPAFCGSSTSFNSDNGNFSHPLSGLPYKPATNCTFTITTSGLFTLWFLAMEIHVTDDLWVYDGAVSFRLTGRETQPPYNTASNRVELRFTSDSVINSDGTGMVVEWHTLTTCPSSCSDHGACRNSLCHCDAGWSGADCATSQGAIPEIPASTDLALDEPANTWKIYKLSPSGLADIYTVWFALPPPPPPPPPCS